MSNFTCPPLLLQSMQEDSSHAIRTRKQDLASVVGEHEIEEISVIAPKSTLVMKNSDVAERAINITAPLGFANLIYQAFFKNMEENGSEAAGTRVNPNDDFSDDEEDDDNDDEIIGSHIKGKKGFWEVFSLSNWRSRGIRELRSIGVAAAALCIFMLGGHQGYQQQKQFQHRRLKHQLQLCNDDKAKQVVEQATSAVGEAPTTSAHISFGGYYGASSSTKSLLDDMLL